jgi:hypothetical protein
MFTDTIFNNKKQISQSYTFEYISILMPLNTNPKLIISTLEKIFNTVQETGGD